MQSVIAGCMGGWLSKVACFDLEVKCMRISVKTARGSQSSYGSLKNNKFDSSVHDVGGNSKRFFK